MESHSLVMSGITNEPDHVFKRENGNQARLILHVISSVPEVLELHHPKKTHHQAELLGAAHWK